MKDKKEISKGEFQHRMFKLIILIIVFVFCCLIIGFIYITLTSSSSSKQGLKIIDNKYQTEESILKSNEKYHSIIEKQDYKYYDLINKNNKTSLLKCDIKNFYKKHISAHFPCLYTFNETDDILKLNNIKNNKDIYETKSNTRAFDYFDKYMKLLDVELYNKNNGNGEYFKNPRLDNLGRIIINNSNKKVHIYVSPLSQIKYFNSYQNKSNSEIVNFYLKNNIDDKLKDNFEEKSIIYYEFDLNEADFIYIPSYYFIQIKESAENLISYEYQDISMFNDMVFKILYSF